jgi:hypothetical protein
MTGAHEKNVHRLAERKGFRLDKVGKGQQRFSIADLVGWKDGVRRSRPRILILTSRSRTVARFARRKGQGHVSLIARSCCRRRIKSGAAHVT